MKPTAVRHFLLVSCLAMPAAHAAQLNDTGQITCYDNTSTPTGTVSSGNEAPESSGFEGQDCSLGAAAANAVGVQLKVGNANVSGRDYTKLDNSGAPLPDSVMAVGRDPGQWSCTRDNVTGLVWLLRLNDGGFGDRDHRYAFGSNNNSDGDTCEGQFGQGGQCTTDPVVQVANSSSLCGGQDWTIPTPAQLESLFAYENPGDPANLIDRQYFPDQVDDGINPLFFWSQTQNDTATPPTMWIADFSFGWISTYPANSAAYLRLVRAAPTPASPRFATSEPGPAGEVVVVDAETGLMWKQCPQGLSGTDCATGTRADLTWSGALSAAGGESFAGFPDWRLPNINELASIRNYAAAGPTDVTVSSEFKGTTAFESYWSSTNDPRASSLGTVLNYQFSGAAAHQTTSKDFGTTRAVRLVRAGNFLSPHAPGVDSTPDSFSLGAKSGPAGSLLESDPIAPLSGLTGPASLRVTGAPQSSYSINGGAWTTLAGAVKNGDQVRVRHQSAASVGATATTTLNIGGVSSDFTSTATPSPPGAPTNVQAVRGNASATLTFGAPANDGGAAISGYVATSSPAGGISNCSAAPATSCNVTGLINGTEYTFTVVASNAAGNSPPSLPSDPVTPATVPGVPSNVMATATGTLGQVSISFTAPSDSGGSDITGYAVTSSPVAGSGTCSAPPATNCIVTGLANEQSYTFRVRAGNDVGFGSASAASNSVAPRAAPTIAFQGTPRSSFPLNHNGGFFLLLRNPDLTLIVDDADTADLQTLAVEVSSSNPSLLPAPIIGFDGVHLFDANATPNSRSATLRPVYNETGTATLTFTVRDADGLTDSVQLTVAVEEGNKAPFATYLTSRVVLPDGFQPGVYEVPGFLLSSSPGDGEELAQTVSHRVVSLNVGGFTLGANTASILPNGTLRLNLSNTQDLVFSTWPVDNGAGDLSRCTGPATYSHAGYQITRIVNFFTDRDFGPGRTFTNGPCGEAWIISAALADSPSPKILLGAERRAIRTVAGKSAAKATGVDYAIRLRNDGTARAEDLSISAPVVTQLGSPTWTCSTTSGSCMPASGQGAILTTVDLDIEEEALVVISGTLPDSTSYVSITPTITFAEGATGNVLGNGVEKIDAVSNAFLFVGSFEGGAP